MYIHMKIDSWMPAWSSQYFMGKLTHEILEVIIETYFMGDFIDTVIFMGM